MFDFISDCKQTIIKYKKQLFSFVLISVFMFATSLSSFAAEVSPDAKNEWFLLPFDKIYFDDSSNSQLVGSFSNSSGTYNGNMIGSGDWLVFSCSDTGAVMPALESGHSYLLYYTFTLDSPSPININRVVFRFDQSSVSTSSGNLPIIRSIVSYVNNTSTSSGICQFSTDSILGGNKFLSTASGIWFNLDSTHSSRGRTSWGFYLYDITDSSESEVNQIVTAINNQTTNIMNAGSSYGGTTSDILSGNDSLSGYIDDYTQIEQAMHDNFESAQSALIGDFTGFTWGSLSNTLNWTSNYLQEIYLNSGDFKMMIILPLLLGIALFFIGRGRIILSNSNKDD